MFTFNSFGMGIVDWDCITMECVYIYICEKGNWKIKEYNNLVAIT